MSYSNPKERELLARVERLAELATRITKLEAQLALARENTQTNGQVYEDAMDRITELEAEKEQYDLNVVAWIQAETEVERLRRIEEVARWVVEAYDANPYIADEHLNMTNALRRALEGSE